MHGTRPRRELGIVLIVIGVTFGSLVHVLGQFSPDSDKVVRPSGIPQADPFTHSAKNDTARPKAKIVLVKKPCG